MNKIYLHIGESLNPACCGRAGAKKGVRKGCAEDVSGSDEVKPVVHNSNSSALTLFLFFSAVNLLTARSKTQGCCRLGEFVVQNARLNKRVGTNIFSTKASIAVRIF